LDHGGLLLAAFHGSGEVWRVFAARLGIFLERGRLDDLDHEAGRIETITATAHRLLEEFHHFGLIYILSLLDSLHLEVVSHLFRGPEAVDAILVVDGPRLVYLEFLVTVFSVVLIVVGALGQTAELVDDADRTGLRVVGEEVAETDSLVLVEGLLASGLPVLLLGGLGSAFEVGGAGLGEEAGVGEVVAGGEGGGAVDFGLEVVDELGLHDECRHTATHVEVDEFFQVGAGASHLGGVEVVLLELLHDQQVDQTVLLEVALALVADLLDVARERHLHLLLQELLVDQRALGLLHKVHGTLGNADCPYLQRTHQLVVEIPAVLLRTTDVTERLLAALYGSRLPQQFVEDALALDQVGSLDIPPPHEIREESQYIYLDRGTVLLIQLP
jgi:hypothetical protein